MKMIANDIPKQWVLASNNQGKLVEFQQLFDNANLSVTLVPQKQLNIQDIEETGLSFIENAILKARHASQKSGLPAVADDSGLCVPCLNGRPGIYSARFAGKHGDDTANNQKLLTELQPIRLQNPSATIIGQFVCVLAFVRMADDPLPIIAQGIWQGEILDKPQGEQGFGYDPLFYLPNLGKTAAELTASEKNHLSHRGQALQVLLSQLKSDKVMTSFM